MIINAKNNESLLQEAEKSYQSKDYSKALNNWLSYFYDNTPSSNDLLKMADCANKLEFYDQEYYFLKKHSVYFNTDVVILDRIQELNSQLQLDFYSFSIFNFLWVLPIFFCWYFFYKGYKRKIHLSSYGFIHIVVIFGIYYLYPSQQGVIFKLSREYNYPSFASHSETIFQPMIGRVLDKSDVWVKVSSRKGAKWYHKSQIGLL